MDRHIAGLQQTKSGSWEIRYRDPKTHRQFQETFKAKSDAVDRLAEVRIEMRKGTFMDPAKGKVTFAKQAATWLQNAPYKAGESLYAGPPRDSRPKVPGPLFRPYGGCRYRLRSR